MCSSIGLVGSKLEYSDGGKELGAVGWLEEDVWAVSYLVLVSLDIPRLG